MFVSNLVVLLAFVLLCYLGCFEWFMVVVIVFEFICCSGRLLALGFVCYCILITWWCCFSVVLLCLFNCLLIICLGLLFVLDALVLLW